MSPRYLTESSGRSRVLPMMVVAQEISQQPISSNVPKRSLATMIQRSDESTAAWRVPLVTFHDIDCPATIVLSQRSLKIRCPRFGSTPNLFQALINASGCALFYGPSISRNIPTANSLFLSSQEARVQKAVFTDL